MIELQIINNFDNKIKLSNKLIEEIILNLITNESQYTKIKISIIIENDDYLRKLKIKYFDLDILTDVITFDLSDSNKELEAEIYISWDRVFDNSKKYKESLSDEAKRVIIHGCLHLMGFNDSNQEEKKIMREKEQRYINSMRESILI